MSLVLDREGTDRGVEVKTFGTFTPEIVFMRTPCGLVEVCQEDFLDAAFYVLTNTNLKPDDYRLRFVEAVKSLVETQGYSNSADANIKRLARGKGAD